MVVLWIYALLFIIAGSSITIMAMFQVDTDIDYWINIRFAKFGGSNKVGVRLILSAIAVFGLGGFIAAYYKWPINHFIAALIDGFIIWYLGCCIRKVQIARNKNNVK